MKVDDTSSRICVLNKAEDVNLNVSNVITRISEAETLIKHISCDCICRFEGIQCKSN